MFENFTERARKVLSLARQEAQRLLSEFIGTEHILLGIIQEGGGVAPKVLKNFNIDPLRIRHEIEKLAIPTVSVTLGEIPLSPRAKKVIELATEEAVKWGKSSIGTGELLLGLYKEHNGIAYHVLYHLGIFDIDRLWEELGKVENPPTVEPQSLEVVTKWLYGKFMATKEEFTRFEALITPHAKEIGKSIHMGDVMSVEFLPDTVKFTYSPGVVTFWSAEILWDTDWRGTIAAYHENIRKNIDQRVGEARKQDEAREREELRRLHEKYPDELGTSGSEGVR